MRSRPFSIRHSPEGDIYNPLLAVDGLPTVDFVLYEVNMKKWWDIVEIYWELLSLDEDMKLKRIILANRKRGRPKINNSLKNLGLKSNDMPKIEFSEVYVWEFYLQLMQYPSSKNVLDWCRLHLKTKELKELWEHPLRNTKDREYFETILDDKIFLSKREDAPPNSNRHLLWVSGSQVFENPFKFIQKHVWIWNSAINYCLKAFHQIGIRGAQEIAFKAALYQPLLEKNNRETIEREQRRAIKNYMVTKLK